MLYNARHPIPPIDIILPETIERYELTVQELEAEVAQLRADGQRLTWLREHYFGANFRYGEPEESVLVFGPLPKSAKITGDFDADVGALAPRRER